MDLSTKGQALVTGVGVGALVLGMLLSFIRMRGRDRALLVFGGPSVAILVFLIAGPDRSCTYDCPNRAAWGLITLTGIVGWAVGFGLVALLRKVVTSAHDRDD